jgi:hypothetical protein
MTDDLVDLAGELQTAAAAVAPGMALTIYFCSPAAEFRDGLTQCLEEYLDRWEPSLAWYADQDVGRFGPASARLLRYPIQRIRNVKRPMPFFSFRAFGGPSHEAASSVGIAALVRENEPRKLSYLRVTFPVDAYRGTEGAAAFVDLAHVWASRLPLLHGYGGLALNRPEASGPRQRYSAAVFALAARFPGFEVDDCGGTVLVAQDAIKGVNWLTLLADRFVESLGGVPALRAKLSAAILLHPVPGRGLIIQAGPAPAVGDVNRGDRLPLYGEVARALQPIRLKTHPDLGPAESGSFGAKGTAAWLRRFD